MTDFQKMFDSMQAMSRNTRSNYHVTLGALIAKLETIPRETPIKSNVSEGLAEMESYRGYYSDLSINPSDQPSTVGAVLDDARKALGAEFTGYKGGEYRMGEETPLWVANYSMCGPAVIAVEYDGSAVTLITKEID